jgi:hypothetical protein
VREGGWDPSSLPPPLLVPLRSRFLAFLLRLGLLVLGFSFVGGSPQWLGFPVRSRPRRHVPVLADVSVSMVAAAPLWVAVFVHVLLGL